MIKTELNAQELKDFINHTIKNNRLIQADGIVPISLEVVGPAGIGKTSIFKQIADENKLRFVKVSLSQIEELGDLVGMPVRQFQMCKEGETDCIWADENAIHTYEAEGWKFTTKKRMTYCPPEWIADMDEGGLLLLDDYTRADMRFLQATMELVDVQEYISWKLPKDWHVFLTSNPSDGEYLVNEMDDAQKTRYLSIGMKFDVKEWAKWAEITKIDGRGINFMLLNPEIVNKKVNPRILCKFFNSIASLQPFEDHLAMITMMGEGSIGPEATAMFVSFINNKLDKLVSPEFIMNKPFDIVEKELKSLIGSTNLGNYRADIANTLCTRVINYSINTAAKKKIEKEYLDRVEDIVMGDFFGSDLNFYLMKTIFSGSDKFRLLAMRKNLTKYVIA